MRVMVELLCNSCKHGKPMHMNKYGELIGGCWRFFICYNPKYVELKSVTFVCRSYEKPQ